MRISKWKQTSKYRLGIKLKSVIHLHSLGKWYPGPVYHLLRNCQNLQAKLFWTQRRQQRKQWSTHRSMGRTKRTWIKSMLTFNSMRMKSNRSRNQNPMLLYSPITICKKRLSSGSNHQRLLTKAVRWAVWCILAQLFKNNHNILKTMSCPKQLINKLLSICLQ